MKQLLWNGGGFAALWYLGRTMWDTFVLQSLELLHGANQFEGFQVTLCPEDHYICSDHGHFG
jgi:hypothetical protein